MRYAIVVDSKVVNIADAEYAVEPNWIPCDDTPAHIGGSYADGKFSAPIAIHSDPSPVRLTQSDVYRKLTPEESKQVLAAATNNLDIALWLRRFDAAPYLDASDADTQRGFITLFGEVRTAEIFS